MQEEGGEETGLRSESPASEGGDPGSESDQDHSQPLLGVPQMSSMEMSLWSLDASATSSMDTSLTAETEVREGREGGHCIMPPLVQFSDLASFLIWKACRSTMLASYFYWYLTVECNDAGKDNSGSVKYEKIRFHFLEQLKNVDCMLCVCVFVSPSHKRLICCYRVQS